MRTTLGFVALGFALSGVAAADNTAPAPQSLTLSIETPLYAAADAALAPVASLSAGATIEVYGQDGDWLAIRPPEGAFSWVSATDVEPTDSPGVLRVIRAGAASWIGAEGGSQRVASQVRLNEGERLQATEAIVEQTPAGETTWYKIDPPDGEFRFVHRLHLGIQPAQPATAAAAVSWETRTESQPAAAPIGPGAAPIATTDPLSPRLDEL
ncbi:MAG: hypothetical protein KDA41_11030, partial [Planctomycetales bacterium]|nr:hypothetical protein [Planctomycetales bacterium]